MNQKKNFLLLVIFFILISTAFFLSPVYLSGESTKETPEVEIFPRNMYRETIHVVADVDYAPYSYLGDDGSPTGHDVELISEIANNMRVNLDLRLTTWDDAINAVKTGQADVVMGADVIADDSGAGMLMTIPLTSDTMTVFGKESIESVGELYGKKIAVIESNGAKALLKSYMLDPYCTAYATYTEVFESVESGENDYAVSNYSVGLQILKTLQVSDIKSTGVVIMQNYFCFGVREDEPELLDRINTELVSLSDGGEISRLQEKWVGSSTNVQSLPDFFREHAGLVWLYIVGVIALLTAFLTITIISAKKNEKMLRRQAETDPLTGLANRAFAEKLIGSILQSESEAAKRALLILDIDNFKRVNDTLGHQQGDSILKSIADVLRKSFREADVVGRLGGDEFFVLMQGVQGKANVETKAKEICGAVVKVCSANGSECRVSTSIGIALSPEHGNSFTQLYAHADAALYHVKSNGRNGYMIYSGEYAAQNAVESRLLNMD